MATMYGQLFSQVGDLPLKAPLRPASSVPRMPQDPMAMARAMQAIMAQAGAWVTQYKTDLAARRPRLHARRPGGDRRVGHRPPAPGRHTAGEPTASDAAEMQRVQKMAMEAVYPEDGFPPEDPRLVPVGMPLVAYAVAARAIGWASEDERAHRAGRSRRSATPAPTTTGRTRTGRRCSSRTWPVATLYGQLFAQSDLPAKPA